MPSLPRLRFFHSCATVQTEDSGQLIVVFGGSAKERPVITQIDNFVSVTQPVIQQASTFEIFNMEKETWTTVDGPINFDGAVGTYGATKIKKLLAIKLKIFIFVEPHSFIYPFVSQKIV